MNRSNLISTDQRGVFLQQKQKTVPYQTVHEYLSSGKRLLLESRGVPIIERPWVPRNRRLFKPGLLGVISN